MAGLLVIGDSITVSTKIQSCYFDIVLKVSKVIAKLIYPYEAVKNIVCLQPLFFKLSICI